MATSMTLLRSALRTSSRGSGRSFSVLSLAEEFPGVSAAVPTPKKGSTASTSTLPCGLTIVTEDSSAISATSLTFPSAGSHSELASEAGAALASRYLSFKSASGLSSALILRHIENRGAKTFAKAGRSGSTLGFVAGNPGDATFLVPLLAVECDFEKWDVRDAIALANTEAAAQSSDAQVSLSDHIYASAYGSLSAAGRSYYTPGASKSAVQSFRERTHSLNGAVLAATGIPDHEAFVRSAEEAFPGVATAAPADPVELAYLGGESRASAPGLAHVALTFQGPASSPLRNVLKHCLAAGGATPFSATGLVGVTASAAASDASAAVDALCAVATSAPSADAIANAIAAAKAEALLSLDSGCEGLVDAMTASVLESCGYSPRGVADAYDAVSADDVAKAFDAMAKGGVSLAAVGDIGGIPYQATIASRFS